MKPAEKLRTGSRGRIDLDDGGEAEIARAVQEPEGEGLVGGGEAGEAHRAGPKICDLIEKRSSTSPSWPLVDTSIVTR